MPYRGPILLALLLLPVTAAQAADDSRGVLSFTVENDAVGDTDEGYTNGLRAAWTSPAGKRPFWAAIGLEKLPLLPRDATLRYETSLGQSMFTPQDIDRLRADPRDRPYAGFTYVGLGVIAIAPPRTSGLQRIDQLQLTLGIIGPASLAGDTQITWHRWFGFNRPNGWDAQLRNEPALNLSYRQSLRLPPARIAGLDADLTPHWGFAIGNVYDYANAGATIRIGSNLPPQGVGRIEPSIAGSGAFNRSRRVHLQAFAGVDARAIARNIFLDGNSFVSGPGVAKNAIVVDVEGGAVLTWRRVRLSYTQVFRSREFKNQPRPANFGSLGLAIGF
ncbi:MAG: hypothetical protein CFE37_10470 [Alphaproteobacteria bacterium PA4]|nr:MAG: hypothetical protein CFE37_10470 [Alphaproteobacteria bacterium PA4]